MCTRCTCNMFAAPCTSIPSSAQPKPASKTSLCGMQIRKVIAKRLLESKLEVPHYYLRGHADLRTVNSLRQMFKEQGSKVS